MEVGPVNSNTGGKKIKTRWVTARLDRLKKLPAPDEDFLKKEIHPRLDPIWQQLISQNVIETVDTLCGSEYPDGGLKQWHTRAGAYEKIQSILENRPECEFPALPCEDHGFECRNGRLHCKMDYHDDGDHQKSWSSDELEYFWEHGELPDASKNAADSDAEVVES